jgi:hypothetical protein
LFIESEYKNFPSLTGISAQLKSIEDTTYKRLSKLEDDVHDMKTGLDEKIRGEVKTIKPSLIEEIKAFEILASIIQTGLPCFGFINKLPCCLLKVNT